MIVGEPKVVLWCNDGYAFASLLSLVVDRAFYLSIKSSYRLSLLTILHPALTRGGVDFWTVIRIVSKIWRGPDRNGCYGLT